MTDKTAERAMAVARFADKFDNLSNLDLPKAVLYELSSGDYPDKVVKTVLKEAASGPIDIGRFYAIDSELNPPPPPSPPSPEEIEERRRLAAEWWAEREAEEKEADAILDGPPPDLPPPEIL